MELNVLENDNGILRIEIKGEGHTLCNDLREELSNDKSVDAAGYTIESKLMSSPILLIKGKNPKKSLEKAIENIKKRNEQLRNLLLKAK